MGIIENFKLDMADELDISFAEAGLVVTTLISINKEKSHIARQKIVNAFAKMIELDRGAAVVAFTNTHDMKEGLDAWLVRQQDQRDERKLARIMKGFLR